MNEISIGMKLTVSEITKRLFDALWSQYVRRVSYAGTYADMVLKNGNRVVTDHIAFRTLNTHTGEQPDGIKGFSHILKCLDYTPAGKYKFNRKKLSATHFEHPDNEFPKIFVSQLEVAELPDWAQVLISDHVSETPYLISDQAIELLMRLNREERLTEEAAEILVFELAGYFRRPWKTPLEDAILKLNEISQYAAWVLLHGNSVNHFAALINFQDVKEWPDMESTCRTLADAGVPMKEHIEGKKGSILRQSSTHAVPELVEVVDENGEVGSMMWSYAYFELTERGFTEENGKKELFSGFLGKQATHLFDMTKTKSN